jgi:hypothetical protein
MMHELSGTDRRDRNYRFSSGSSKAGLPPGWDILIATIPHRHEKLCALLAELDRQIEVAPPSYYLAGVGAIVCRDNLELSIAAKRQALLDAAASGYVSFIDDDDLIYPGFVSRVMNALWQGPDYVGFTVEYTVDGEQQALAEHSIRYPGWHTWPEKMVRDISHLNPVRRDIAALARFEGGYSEDSRWADQLRATGKLVTEAWVTGYAYRYQFSPADCADTPRTPLPDGQIPPLPAYPWLRVLTTPESV